MVEAEAYTFLSVLFLLLEWCLVWVQALEKGRDRSIILYRESVDW